MMLSQGKNGRQVPFQEPAAGWTRWSSNSEDGRQLKTLLQNGTIHNGMSALDVQIYFPQFQVYAPSNFCKNLSRIRRESGVRTAGTPPAVPIPPVTGSGAAVSPIQQTPPPPPAPVQAPPNPFPNDQHVSFAMPVAAAASPVPAPALDDEDEMMMLPHLFKVMDNGRYKSATLQLLCMSAPMKWKIDGNFLVGRYIMSENFTNPLHALGKFKNKDGSPAYPVNHIARVAHEKAVYEKQGEDLCSKINWTMKLDLGMRMSFHTRDGFEKKIIVFSKSGEYHQYINLIEEGALAKQREQDEEEDAVMPSHISVSGGATIGDEVDNMTTQFSTFGGPTDRDDYTFQTVRSNASFRSASMQSVHSLRSKSSRRSSSDNSRPSLRRTDANPSPPVRQASSAHSVTPSSGSFAGGPGRNAIDAAAAAGAAAGGDEASTFSIRSRASKRIRSTPKAAEGAIVAVDPDL